MLNCNHLLEEHLVHPLAEVVVVEADLLVVEVVPVLDNLEDRDLPADTVGMVIEHYLWVVVRSFQVVYYRLVRNYLAAEHHSRRSPLVVEVLRFHFVVDRIGLVVVLVHQQGDHTFVPAVAAVRVAVVDLVVVDTSQVDLVVQDH